MPQPLDTLNQHTKTLFAKTLGLRFIEATPERVAAEIEVRDELCTTPGILHGGARSNPRIEPRDGSNCTAPVQSLRNAS